MLRPRTTSQVFAAAPGLFTADGTGAGQAAAINQDGTINSASNPAPIGSVISLYATGGGQTSPAGVDGQVSTSPLARQSLPVQVYIGQQIVTTQLQYAGPAPGEIAGLMQINVPLHPLSLRQRRRSNIMPQGDSQATAASFQRRTIGPRPSGTGGAR